MDYLTSFKKQLALRIILGTLLPPFFGGIAWILLVEYTEIDDSVALIIAIVVFVLTATAAAKKILNSASHPLEQLQQVIAYSSNSEREAAAPELNIKAPGQEVVKALSRQIYDIASSVPTNQNSNRTSKLSKIDEIPIPIVGLGNDMKITFCNAEAKTYFNYENEMIGQPLYDVVNLRFNDNNNFDKWLEDVSKNSIMASTQWSHVRHYTDQENFKQFDLSVKYSKGSSSGTEVVLAFFDKTEAYNNDEGEFSLIALAVHELRTPLTVMRGYIEVFQDELGPIMTPEMLGFMHKMEASSQQLVAFVANILNVAKIEENQLSLQLHPEDWGKALTSAVNDLKLRAQVRNIQLKLTIEDGLPEVAIDKVSTYEVINNLVDNALKYTHDGDEIIISTKLSPEGLVETSIEDHGIGIPQAVIGDLFKKFHRSHKSRVQVGGTGIGLYLSKALVHAHGGTIAVKSKEGEGSTFTFTLQTYTDFSKGKNLKEDDIIRGAHGWIKNHSLYRN